MISATVADQDDHAELVACIKTLRAERGDILDDDNTVEGVTPGSKWKCRHEKALVPPARAVVDFHPDDARPK